MIMENERYLQITLSWIWYKYSAYMFANQSISLAIKT